MEYVQLVILTKKNGIKLLIGTKEKKNWLNCAINTEKMMGHMIVLWEAVEERTVFLHLGCLNTNIT